MMRKYQRSNPVKRFSANAVCAILFCCICAVAIQQKLEWVDTVIFVSVMVLFPLTALYKYLTK